MPHNKNHLTASLLAAAFWVCPLSVYADALATNKIADINFGVIDFDGATGSGNITMGSNGIITYGNNTSGAGTGTPAQLEITGDEGVTVTIACSTSGSITRNGAAALQINPVRFNIGSTNTTSYLGGTECAGTGTSVGTLTIGPTASGNTIFIGGQLVTDAQPLTNGTYQGTSSGGNPPEFLILVQ